MSSNTVELAGAGLGLMLAASSMGSAAAQTAPASVATTPPAVAAPPAKIVAKSRECTRLPLSDIQVGREKTIEVARLRLDEYIAKVAKEKKWKSWDKSLETVACDEYLFVPLLGQEYKCLVTATFCKKS